MLNAPFFLVMLHRLYDVVVSMASFPEMLAVEQLRVVACMLPAK